MIPKKTIILLSGIPATRKSTFGHHLAREHSFAHYDLECDPRCWSHPELKEIWDNNRSVFVAELRRHHERVALDWGFPPSCLHLVEELRANGVQLIWFDGDIACARGEFEKRGDCKGSVENFNRQIAAIQSAGFPASLNCLVIPALSSSGAFLDLDQIKNIVFPPV